MSDAVRTVLMYFVLPVWVAAGFADWVCHRRSRLAETAGPRESLLHLLMFAEMGLVIVCAIFLEITSLTIFLMTVLLALHQVTAYWDLRYAGKHREISAIEQQIHSFLEMMPLLALILVCLSHWDQALALAGLGTEEADFGMRLREPSLSIAYLAFFFSAVLVFSVIPYMEELWRGIRVQKERAMQIAAAQSPAELEASPAERERIATLPQVPRS